MKSKTTKFALAAVVTFLLASCGNSSSETTSELITENKAKSDDVQWTSHGLDPQETRHSPLNKINNQNVGKLGLAWSYDLGSERGVEATPLVIDGVMYVTASWSILHAIDALTGKKLWSYDPKVPPEFAKLGCCDVVNRGVAFHDGKIFLAAYDGWLHALDAKTGKKIWKEDTFEKRGKYAYTSTGAPRVVGDKVVIGNGGAEFGVRGYVTAYNVNSGKQAWRWYVVPGDPDKPYENDAMEMAAKTWDPSAEYWKAGGGGTVWDSMAYDPELNLLYIGTGNGSPWNHNMRSPAGGDNLYLSSIVALNPDSGEYVWHYQGTPGDNWDYTHAQHIILADIEIDGKLRKVAMQAPKNGFFFVIDRITGEFISAENFVEVAWATGYDKNGRPIEVPAARSITEPWEVIPSQYGAHNWHPMSYNPDTGLVYIPAQGIPVKQAPDTNWELNKHQPSSTMSGVGWNLGYLLHVAAPEATPFGTLIAWDPVAQKEVWRSEYISPWNGGTLTTAGNLVFQGTADGRFIAYDATNGESLWQVPVTTGVVAAPITWSKNGEQYVSIAVGWGGVYGLMQKATDKQTPGKVLTFKIGGEAEMPNFVFENRTELVEGAKYNPDDVAEGLELYVANCLFCHGTPGINNGGAIPNLGYSSKDTLNSAENWVIDGAGLKKGMPVFEHLTKRDVKKVVAFIQGTADAIRPQK
jgi:quinohemoprotein ethanol dehydrogenase